MMRLLSIVALTVAFALGTTPLRAAEPMTVLLDWFVNPDHAPLIVAKEHGHFSAAGLEVRLIAPADPNDPPKLVAAGKADLAISYQPQLHLQIEAGLPLRRIATLVATPLNSLVVLKDGPIKTIADLKGKTIGFSIGGFEDAILGRMLEQNGLKLSDVKLVNVNFSLSPSIISGNVDGVIGAFRNFELNQMDIVGRAGRAFYPEEHGVPPYDELIVVANSNSLDDAKHRKFLSALEAATIDLINNPEGGWATFIKAHPDLDNELNKRAWRDTLRRFALRPRALDKARYARFAAFLAETKLIKKARPVEAYAVEIVD
ncbi:MAG: ABC transporter substrate-binding protein [Hyphomicrobiaceae bacterium]